MREPSRGIYEQLVTSGLDEALRRIDPSLVSRGPIDPADGYEILARHLADLSRRALREVGDGEASGLVRQVELANEIARAIARGSPNAARAEDLVAESRDLLLAIVDRANMPGAVSFPQRPEVPLSIGALLVNGRHQPRIGTEVQRELASADNVDLLCAFIMWYGLRLIDDQLESFVRRGGRLRVITTTYAGATERRALDRLAALGAEVKVSFETHSTRLHAKAWLFRRDSGYSTAYVGSSNLSKTALVDGIEWNVRISGVEQPHVLETFQATFEDYWGDSAFEPYDPQRAEDRERLDRALAAERAGPTDLPLDLAALDVVPRSYQREILEELDAERVVRGERQNLVVMATGTGKTVVAALDYRRLQARGDIDSLLFVAHREELLRQARSVFRQVMREGSFGERFVAGERPRDWRHVFASIQSLSRLDLERNLDPRSFDMVIVDEFHHAEADTYSKLLRHLQPKQLLGLTATPERSDGRDVRDWFGGRTAAELRLWEALEQGFLAPFQYFGIHDDTDLRTLRWTRGSGYETAELSNVYTGHDVRARIVIQAVDDKIPVRSRMRALGFCVSIDHAEFMASRFKAAGIPSLAVTSRSTSDERNAALLALRKRSVNVLFTVDLYNEGVDIPEIDTVLFLRPTESATVFLQQLGRGLRLAESKPCLTVLDFIGHQHAKFRFDLRYRALNGSSRRELARDIKNGFPTLPAGCHIQLDRVAADIVMQNVATSLRIDWRSLAAELRSLGDVSLETFLAETGLEIDDLYRRQHGGWVGLKRAAGLETRPVGDDDERLGAAIGRMLHIDDPERLQFIEELLRETTPPAPPALGTRAGRLLTMAHFALWGPNEPPDRIRAALMRLWSHAARREELLEMIGVLQSRIRRVTRPIDVTSNVPLHVHARYTRDEALGAFGVSNPGTVRQGVKWVADERADVFFVTLRKTERHFSPTTMYADRAVTPSLFQWESQNTTSEASPMGQRYLNHERLGSTVHLFIRETKEGDGGLGAPPYLYAGKMTYRSHTGDRPLRILWQLAEDLPADIFHDARVAS